MLLLERQRELLVERFPSDPIVALELAQDYRRTLDRFLALQVRGSEQAREVLNKTGEVVSAVDAVAIDRLIQELSRAAASIRVFADYLDRHPEALIRGKNR